MYFFLFSAFMFFTFIVFFIIYLKTRRAPSKNSIVFLIVSVFLFLGAIALLSVGMMKDAEYQKKIRSNNQSATLTSNTTSTPSIAVIPEPTITPLFALGEPYTARFQNILSNWQWYSYSTTPPLEKDDDYWPFNTNHFSLSPESVRLFYRTECEYFSSGTIGAGIGGLCHARLFSFPDNTLVQQKSADNADIEFKGIPAGDYYYSVSCDGYETYYSSVLRFEGAGDDILAWSIPLATTEETNFLAPFPIQLVDQNQIPIKNKKFYLSSTTETDLGDSYYPFITDENGVLCFRSWSDGVENLNACLFSVIDGLSISISDENFENLTSFLPIGDQMNQVIIAQ